MRNPKAIDPLGSKKVPFTRKSVIAELSRILNTCKTERGLGRAVANYVVKLKQK